MMIRFHDPLYLLLIPLIILYLLERRQRRAAFRFSTAHLSTELPVTLRTRLRVVVPVLWAAGMILLALALARPQSGHSYNEYTTKGIDIVLTIDCSGSMLSEDFKPNNRLYVAREVVKEFVQSRANDRLGLVVFAGQAFTQCPLTLDHGILLTFLEEVRVGLVEDGTAIGNALAVAVDRLRKSDAKSRVIVLLTDGKNNRGEIDPLTAAEIARTFDVKVYTIGVGIRGLAMMPVEDPVFGKRYVQVQVDIDEDILTKIATETGGRYFRATDPDKLKSIYETIGELEKSTVKMKEYTSWNEYYYYFLIPGAILLLVSLLLDVTVLRRFP